MPKKCDTCLQFQGDFTLTYNFYDFSEQHPDLANFDIRPCYAGKQLRHFLIKFQGTLLLYIMYMLYYIIVYW